MHPALYIGLVILGGAVGFFAALKAHRRSSNRPQNGPYRRREPSPPRIVVLGPCGICQGDVTNINGYQSPCNHYIHHTCAFEFSRPSQSEQINWTDVCKYCLSERMNDGIRRPKNEGLRNRGANRQKCAECRREFVDEDEIQLLRCKRHRAHKTCWDEMETSGLTTCSMCMDEM